MDFTLPDPGPVNPEFARPASRADLERAAAALAGRGFVAHVADSGKEASAHAVTMDGEVIVGSGSGSQLGAYAYAAGHVILVVGHQKLVRDVPEGLRRLREYSLPREFGRMQGLGRPGTLLAKTLIIDREPTSRVTVILVPETLGF